jgi:PAT family beta-lactamase induction signal transducer AmpG
LKEYFSRPGALTVLSFIILYKLGDNIALNMTIPFILKSGFSKEEYVAIAKIWGLGATLLGGLIGGFFVYRIGIIKSLFAMGIVQALSNAGFLLLANAGRNIPLLMFVIGFENLAIGMGTSAQAAFMGSITNKKFSATQFALLSSLMAVPGIIFASRAGDMAEHLGWPLFFFSCALLSLPGLFLIPFLYNEPKNRGLAILKQSMVMLTMAGGLYALVRSVQDLINLF